MTLAGMVAALEIVDIGVLVGLTMAKVSVYSAIDRVGGNTRWHGEDEIRFESTCGRAFRLYHSQDCCETVEIEVRWLGQSNGYYSHIDAGRFKVFAGVHERTEGPEAHFTTKVTGKGFVWLAKMFGRPGVEYRFPEVDESSEAAQ